MIVGSDEIGVKVMMELCQGVLDGREMLDEWKTSVIMSIFKGKGDVISCGSYTGVKLLEQGWPTRGSRAACGSSPGSMRLFSAGPISS